MIDIHSHILPGMDDGAKTIEDSIELALEAVENGITIMVATPHHQNGIYLNHKEDVLVKVAELQAELDARQIPLKVLPGQEIHVYPELIDDLRNNRLLTIGNQSKYILLELPYDHVPRFMDQLFFEIQLAGFIPIIPHPERNTKLRENPHLLYQWVKKGALAQITAASLLGKFGKEAQKFAYQCMEHHLCHLVSSDAHRVGKRGVLLKEAYDEISNKYGDHLVSQLINNANQVVAGEDFYVDPPVKIENKRSLFAFWKKKSG